jgi:hypothetical protein
MSCLKERSVRIRNTLTEALEIMCAAASIGNKRQATHILRFTHVSARMKA